VDRTTRVAALLLLVAGCASSAPYTIPAAALNTALAGGFSAAQRSMGGCYATCTNGTACNPRTGFCEKTASSCACPAGEVCLESADGATKCVPPAMTIFSEQQQVDAPPIVITPEGGVVPTLPVPAPAPSTR
jgi:hypothetical protein